MKPSLLIWDWNGTILMDVQECFDIANHMLAERGIPCIKDMNTYREVFGFPIKAYYENLGYRFDKESYETEGDSYIDEDPIIEKSTTTKVENDEVKRLVKSLEKSTQKN